MCEESHQAAAKQPIRRRCKEAFERDREMASKRGGAVVFPGSSPVLKGKEMMGDWTAQRSSVVWSSFILFAQDADGHYETIRKPGHFA